ncbi:carboxypeptidase-like regulatory domain-containing protein [Gilvibacter sp.]|uniref:carboxypeptidase-like regulatory domain-containing protein n=1 Tax=Gilvibacter sp. TaxID=2729997 RepID=UPI003F49BF20
MNTRKFYFLFLFALFISETIVAQTITVIGKVTYQESPLVKVNIRVVNTNQGTETAADGTYQINAEVGQTLRFSHVGFKDVEILLEETSTVLNVPMDDFVESLDEVVVTAYAPAPEEDDLEVVMNVKLAAPFGRKFNPAAHGGVVYYLDQREIRMLANPDLNLALKDRYAGVKGPFTWMVDDIEWKEAPVIAYSEIVQMYLANVPGVGPTVFIRTVNAPEQLAAKRAKEAEKYKNQNFYQDDALNADGTPAEQTLGEPREVKGTITFLEAPIPDVNIKVKGTSRGTKTNRRGRYTIEVSPGETLLYSHVSFKEVEILVEDITERIDLEMIEVSNELDEVVITVTNAEGISEKRRKKAERPFETSRGRFDPSKAGYAVGVVDGEELSNTYSSLKEALKGKISGYSVGVNGRAYLRGGSSSATQDYPVAWEVDGVFTTDEPTYLDLSQIEAIYALKSLAATNKYGTLGAGGVIVIRTKYGSFNAAEKKKQEDLAKLQNQNYYSDDAAGYGGIAEVDKPILDALKAKGSAEAALEYYMESLQDSLANYGQGLIIARWFAQQYGDLSNSQKVLEALSNKHLKNPEIQKAIAYFYQELGMTKAAVEQYKKVARLRPEYAQSFRDLANAHLENSQFVLAWRVYMSYILGDNDISGEGIGKTIYSEMEYIYFNRSNQAKIKEKFVPIHDDIQDFRADVRLVFEWNTSEAEFDIEFVNPERRAYSFNHSLADNQDLITDEKTKGFSSKEFFVEDLQNGEWLVNFTYRGNKKPEPTFVKLTVYYDWGKPSQRQEVRVYSFQDQRVKLQLLRLTDTLLAVNND